MREQVLELSVGDVVIIGDQMLTVIDIDDSEVSFRVDSLEPDELAIEHSERILRPQK